MINKAEELINKIENMIKVEDLMTQIISVEFWTDKKTINSQINSQICENKDLSFLPTKDEQFYYEYKGKGEFSEKTEISKNIRISPKMSIDKLIKHFSSYKINFVFEEEKMVGIIHISDLINIYVYTYLYAIFSWFEQTLRDLLYPNYKNEDIIMFLRLKLKKRTDLLDKEQKEKEKEISDLEKNIDKVKISEFQHFNLRVLLKFIHEKNLINKGWSIRNKDHINNLVNVRNTIMHSKDLMSRNEDSEIDFSFYNEEDFDKFFVVYNEINGLLFS